MFIFNKVKFYNLSSFLIYLLLKLDPAASPVRSIDQYISCRHCFCAKMKDMWIESSKYLYGGFTGIFAKYLTGFDQSAKQVNRRRR